jgi:RHS repeat-associated protein
VPAPRTTAPRAGQPYLTDKNGLIVEHEEYLPSGEEWFEELRNGSASNRLPWKFNGKELDETGLYYYGARYYNPRAGVWLSPDPIFDGSMMKPIGLALYTYAHNNPVRMTDPTGLQTVPGAEGAPGWVPERAPPRYVPAPRGLPPRVGPRPRGPVGETPPPKAPVESPGPSMARFPGLSRFLGWLPTIFFVEGTEDQAKHPLHSPPVPGGATPVNQPEEGPAPTPPTEAPLEPAAVPSAAPVPGPAATLELAEQIAREGSGAPWSRTVSLLETAEGPTLVAGGSSNLSPAQAQLAQQLGLTVVSDFPDADAELRLLDYAGRMGLTPTNGVASNKVCTTCAPFIRSLGGWVNGRHYGF